MTKPNQIIEIPLTVAEAADISVRAAWVGMSPPEFGRILLLSAAYGVTHPEVKGVILRPGLGQSGPKTPDGEVE